MAAERTELDRCPSCLRMTVVLTFRARAPVERSLCTTQGCVGAMPRPGRK